MRHLVAYGTLCHLFRNASIELEHHSQSRLFIYSHPKTNYMPLFFIFLAAVRPEMPVLHTPADFDFHSSLNVSHSAFAMCSLNDIVHCIAYGTFTTLVLLK